MKLAQLNTLGAGEATAHYGFANKDNSAMRQEAYERFKLLGLPKNKHEIFGSTGVKKIYEVEYHRDENVSEYVIPKSDNHRIVFVEGWFNQAQSSLPHGVSVEIESHPRLLHESKNPFYFLSYALNDAFYSVRIKEETQLQKPLEIVYVNNKETAHTHMHVSLHVGANAKVDVYERLLVGSGSLFNHTLALHVSEGAQISHVHEQKAHEKAHIISNYHYVQGKDSKASIYSLEAGAALCVSVWDIFLRGDKAQMDFVALQLPKNEQHLSTIVALHHDAPNTHSSQLIKQVINDSAKGVVDAKVVVSKHGVGTKSNQLCNSLILSDKAQVQAFVKPQLEIFIDELEASHGATVGSLNEEQLYYLMSRGIAYERARELLIDAFTHQAYERFPEYAKGGMGAT
ncbi:MAG: SufD family Fe-S cluster assembly protein [Campylobacterales bacterium]|nr:SufD family Fe-S cluster assembly protein [Campylobacterales bacterium]